jgi:hypothetical protein
VSTKNYEQLLADYRHVVRERDRLQRVIDSRPAINAALPESYIEWSQSIYAMDMTNLSETKQ